MKRIRRRREVICGAIEWLSLCAFYGLSVSWVTEGLVALFIIALTFINSWYELRLIDVLSRNSNLKFLSR